MKHLYLARCCSIGWRRRCLDRVVIVHDRNLKISQRDASGDDKTLTQDVGEFMLNNAGDHAGGSWWVHQRNLAYSIFGAPRSHLAEWTTGIRSSCEFRHSPAHNILIRWRLWWNKDPRRSFLGKKCTECYWPWSEFPFLASCRRWRSNYPRLKIITG